MIEALVVYDVSTADREGERRLRRVAKACEGIGVRVQKSVFELRCSEVQLITLIASLRKLVTGEDSVRIYRLRLGTFDTVQQLGATHRPSVDGAVIW